MTVCYRIAIIGSGTAGLATACFLGKAGHNITLFESFETPRPVGAGLMLQPTGLACLANLDLDEAAIQCGTKIYHLEGRTQSGQMIFDLDYRDLSPSYFGLGIHRGALFTLLFDKLKSLSIPIQTDTRITSSHITSGHRILTDEKQNQYGPFDLVIDASGKGSVLRAPDAVKLNKAYPYGALWGVVEDPDQIFGGNRLAQRYLDARIMAGMLAIGENPDTGKKSCAFFWSLPERDYAAWQEAGLQSWKNTVAEIWPDLLPFVRQFKSADHLTYARYGDIIMRRWHEDKLIHIGDAAHHSSPQLGQGVNLALADALILSHKLNQSRDVNAGLAAYQRERKQHVRFYQQASRMLTPFFQSDSRLASKSRDLSFGVLCKTPFVKTEMLRTLAGTKTGWLSHMNPGQWHKKYALNASQKRGR